MDAKKQIEEMARSLIDKNAETIGEVVALLLATIAECLYHEGYCKQNEWISVDERLPKELTHIIVCDEDGTVGEALYLSANSFEWLSSEELAFVTHWMPLPEPPMMKGGAE